MSFFLNLATWGKENIELHHFRLGLPNVYYHSFVAHPVESHKQAHFSTRNWDSYSKSVIL